MPHYIPKATIEFPAILGDTVTKNIELTNPSKQAISYYVRLIGCDDFKLDTNIKIDPVAGRLEIVQNSISIRIEPGQTIPFPIKFVSRISKVVKGKVIFHNKKEGNVQAAAMVFELVSNVYDRNSIDIYHKTTKLYKALPIELTIDNGFPQEVVFQVQILYEKNQPQGQQKDKKGKNPKDKKAQAPKKDEKAQTGLIPEPFTCKQDSIKILKGR